MEEHPNRFISSLKFPFGMVALIWAVFFFEFFTGLDFTRFGLYPRTFYGLRGIVFSPLLHGDFQHLLSNSAPLFFLTVILVYFYRKVAVQGFAMIYLLTGFAVWLFAIQRGPHIGASGVVYGLLSFVFWSGVFRRSLKSIILSLIVTFLYSGYFIGILPDKPGVSWESHLLGGVVGIFAAYWFKEKIEADEVVQPPSWENEPEDTAYFLGRDVFEKTKTEREHSGEA